MNISFSLKKSLRARHQPKYKDISKWLKSSLVHKYSYVYIEVLFVDSNLSREYNLTYRGQNKPTNVISFEYSNSRNKLTQLYGELILCDEVIIREAKEQNKAILEHYAHMFIHGMLHLQGYDHQKNKEAVIMENMETQIMALLGFDNPYVVIKE